MKKKKCAICKVEKCLSNFGKKGKYAQAYCKPCQIIYRKKHYVKNKKKYQESASRSRVRKRDYIHRLKSSKPCMDCGVIYPYYVMDFDHVRGTKVERINVLSQSAGKENLEAELAKCDLVCANCHRERTHQRRLRG